ncbi:MAG: hypothetical protein JO180_04435 [Gemmatirosa sp.]|nr:hypothetical protein [Gemmatirosa sp.]
MTEPPVTAERLLETLGADPEFRDMIVGDLREEHALRLDWDGEHAARRWYRREALRVAPHLLRDGVRRLGWRGTRRAAGTAMTAVVCAYLAHVALVGIVLRATHLLYGDTGTTIRGAVRSWTLDLSRDHPVRGPIALALLLALTALPPLVSGVAAATQGDDAPVFPVLAACAVQLADFLIQLAFGFPGPTGPVWAPGPFVPAWVVVCQCLLVTVGPVVGAAFLVSERARFSAPRTPA